MDKCVQKGSKHCTKVHVHAVYRLHPHSWQHGVDGWWDLLRMRLAEMRLAAKAVFENASQVAAVVCLMTFFEVRRLDAESERGGLAARWEGGSRGW